MSSGFTPRELCERLGIPYTLEPHEGREIPWDGERMHLCYPIADEFHEIGHWLVAEACLRSFKGFGMGSGYDWRGQGNDGPNGLSEYEEPHASAVGIALHALHDPGAAEVHAIDHGWGLVDGEDSDRRYFEQTLQKATLAMERTNAAGVDLSTGMKTLFAFYDKAVRGAT